MGNMSNNKIKNGIITFYNNHIFQELKAYYGKTTLFNILKIERNENRHSAFLAWLLDENGSHGLGEEPLKRFMRLLSKMDSKYDEPFLVGNYKIENSVIVTEKPVKVRDHEKTGRIDIFIDFDYKLFERKLGNDETSKLNHVHVIVENKVYTDEHDDQTKLYYDWARQEYKGKHNQTIIGVFLAPEEPKQCSGDTEGAFSYVKITYQDLLQNVVEPLLLREMPQEARVFLTDYIINLGQPVRDKKDDGNDSNNQDTILAISNENQGKFIKLYVDNQELFDAALYANCCERNPNQLKAIFHDLEKFKTFSKEDLSMLRTFWDANSGLLRMILDTALRRDKGDDEESKKAIGILLRLNESNRDNTKYLVYAKDGTLINDGNKPAPKSLASFYVFKAWMHDNHGASLSDIRKAFSVCACAKHYSETYQYLFYRKADVEYALQNSKNERTYYIAALDEFDETTRKGKKYLTWDFFTDGKHCLEIQDEKVLNIKMWLKEEFDHLIDYAKDSFGIIVEEQ